MSGNRKPKFNYKLFNLKTGKYMSWNQKATWTSRNWVAARLHGEKVHEIEVHIFPVNEPIRQSAAEFLQEELVNEEIRKNKKMQEEERQRQIRKEREYQEDLQKLKALQERIQKYQQSNFSK